MQMHTFKVLLYLLVNAKDSYTIKLISFCFHSQTYKLKTCIYEINNDSVYLFVDTKNKYFVSFEIEMLLAT